MVFHVNALRSSGTLYGTLQPAQMPKPRAGKLENATARRRLEVRRKPYYATISPGIQLGYRRNIGRRLLVRTFAIGQGADWIKKKIALADDLEPADGKTF